MRRKLWSLALSLVVLGALTAAGMAGRVSAAPMPAPIKVTQTSPAALGSSITIAWSVKNNSNTPWNGSFVFNMDSSAVSGLDQPNNVTILKGATKSGTYTFQNPGPGQHILAISFIDLVGLGGGGEAQPPPQQIDPSNPKPVTPKAPKPGPTIKILASGFLTFNGSQAAPIGPNGLTDAQKNALLSTYAPLMLYSYDHGSDEKWSPIDVVDFIHASNLQSKDSGVPSQPQSNLQNAANLLTATLASLDGAGQTATALPRNAFLTPNGQAQSGTPWPQVMSSVASGDPVGMYGHVTLETLATVTDNVLPPPNPFPNQPIYTSVLQEELAGRYQCSDPTNCNAQIIKIEFWQFYGYSHDFENPGGAFTNLLGPATSEILAELIDHSGDWCTVQLYVDASWAFSSHPDKGIVAVYHSAHGVQFGFDMGQATGEGAHKTVAGFPLTEVPGPNFGRSVNINFHAKEPDSAVQAAQNNVVQLGKDPTSGLFVHPVVYVEWGGHEFFPTSGWRYKYASKHNGAGKYHYIATGVRNLGEVGQSTPNWPQAELITDFAGYWGNILPGGQNGPPQGPTLHTQWFWDPKAPITTELAGHKQTF